MSANVPASASSTPTGHRAGPKRTATCESRSPFAYSRNTHPSTKTTIRTQVPLGNATRSFNINSVSCGHRRSVYPNHGPPSFHFALLPLSLASRLLSVAAFPSPSCFFHDGHREPSGTRDPFPQHNIRLSLAQRRMYMPLLHPSFIPTKTASQIRHTRVHHTRKCRDIRRWGTRLLGWAGPRPSLVFSAGVSRRPRGSLGTTILP